MYRHPYQKLIGIFALFLIVIACLPGCKGDPCSDTVCNNGACNAGECVCQQGWAGTQCDSLLRDRLLGNLWQNSLQCQTGSNLLQSTLSAGNGALDEIDIHNLYLQGDSVRAIVTAETLWIHKQEYGQDYIEGWAVYNETSFTLDFHVQTTIGGKTNCLAVFQR